MRGENLVMENKMDKFIKIEEENKVALIDPVGKVCLGVSKKMADNLELPEVQEKLYPVWKQQIEFVAKLEAAHEPINTVYLMVTRKCNMNCNFCAINANEHMRLDKEFKLEDIRNKVVPFLKENEPHKLIITGGEPLIKNQIIEIVKCLHDNLSCPIILQSNGLSITQKMIRQLSNYINEIDFSTKHMFETTQKEEELIRHIQFCQKAGIKVVLSFIFEKTNEDDLYRLIDIAAQYDTDVIFNIVTSVGRAKNNSEILTDIEHIDMHLKIAKYLLKKGYVNKKICEGLNNRIQVRDSCGGYGKVMAIYPEGNIYMCQSMEKSRVGVGNILTDTPQSILENFEKLLNSDYIKEMFCVAHKKICKDCDYRYICGGKCAAIDDSCEYRCIFTKAMLKYSLFHYDYRKQTKENLEEFITYMEKVKETEEKSK